MGVEGTRSILCEEECAIDGLLERRVDPNMREAGCQLKLAGLMSRFPEKSMAGLDFSDCLGKDPEFPQSSDNSRK